MKAVLCKQHGLPDTLVLEDVPSPEPGPKQVVITVKACGVNFPDTLIIQNKYQFKPAPKSSNASFAPNFLMPSMKCRVLVRSCSATLSVISKHSKSTILPASASMEKAS